jgi:hypothetical protein
MKIEFKAVTFQNNWPSYNWNAVPNWNADAGTTLVGNQIEIEADEANAQFTARGEWTGSIDKKAPHAIRIVRASDGEVIATSPTATGAEGVVNATATANVVAGELYQLQFYSESAQPGTIQPPSSGLFGGTPGTFLQIV